MVCLSIRSLEDEAAPFRTKWEEHERPLCLYMMHFSLYPRNLDIIECTKLTAFFFILVPPEKFCIYGTDCFAYLKCAYLKK